MAAPKGNQFYLLRETSGVNKKYSHITLKKEGMEYFQWCLDNPLEEPIWDYIAKRTFYKKVPRPFKINELCRFLGVARITFDEYCKSEDQDLAYIANILKEIIKDQKFDYASIGVFKENLIAKEIGLVDKKEITVEEKQPLFPDRDTNHE